MPTQRDMNFFTVWKPKTGEPMEGKKNRERFSIKFNENDPAHDTVIRLLEKQGSHSKAQFIVNAVLHYVNCPKAPDISLTQTADRASIEKIVMEILHSGAGEPQDALDGADCRKRLKSSPTSAEPLQQKCGTHSEQKEIEFVQNGMDEDTWSMIADTMSAFRNS